MRLARMTKQRLCDTLYSIALSAEKPMSRLDFCHAMGRAKSPNIIGMIEHLHLSGYLKRAVTEDEFGQEFFVYEAVKRRKKACQDLLDK